MGAPCRNLKPARDEAGIALVMALMFLIVVGILGASIASYVVTNQNTAVRATVSQRAFALAEAGVNDALSTLYAAADPALPDTVPATTTSLDGGTVTYSGSLTGTTWTLTGTGSVYNPPSHTNITKTTSVQVNVIYDMRIWNYVYSDATTPCVSPGNNSDVTSPLYIKGDLCIPNNVNLIGSPVQVEGTVTTANHGFIGQDSTHPIAVAKLKKGCTGGNPDPHPCTSADHVYASTISQTPDGLTKPPIDLAGWYRNASPGPLHYCTTGSMPGGFDTDTTMNTSRSTFELTPSTAYDCRTGSGRLSWTPGSPGTLTISGTIFFDGSMTVSGNAVYNGTGVIYLSGTAFFGNGSKLCAVSACDATWDPNAENVMLAIGAPHVSGRNEFELSNNSAYQGAAYVVGNYFLQNNAANWGPVIANWVDIKNNGGQWEPNNAPDPGGPAHMSLTLVPQSYNTG